MNVLRAARNLLVGAALLGAAASASAVTVLAVTDTFSGAGVVNSRSHTFTIDTPGTYLASLVDNELFAAFSVLALGITKSGGDTLGTLGGPGSFSFSASAAGSYTAVVGGIVGPGGLLPIGTYGITVSLIPEAEVWAMMVVGVGLVGWQLRRRSRQSEATRLA